MPTRENILAYNFAYFTECNLATLEGMKSKKSTPKYELIRQGGICEQMVNICKNLKIDCVDSYGRKMIRLSEMITQSEDSGK